MPLTLIAAAICTSPIQGNAQTFQPAINLSNNSGDPEDAQIAANGNSLYVAWADSTPGNFDILFRRSTDGGATWLPTLNISNSVTTSRGPHIVVSGSNVFIVWDDYTTFNSPHMIMFRRSIDGGATFESAQQLSEPSKQHCTVNVAAAGSIVFVYWLVCGADSMRFRRSASAGTSFETLNTLDGGNSGVSTIKVSGNNVYILTSPNGLSDAFLVRHSTDGGVSFNSPVIIRPKSVFAASLVANGNDLYLIWQITESNIDIFFSRSTDGGATFTPSINLSNVPGAVSAHNGSLSVVDQDIYVVWSESDTVHGTPPFPTASDTVLRRSTDGGATFDPKVNLSNNKNSAVPEVAASGKRVCIGWNDWDGLTTNTGDVVLRASDDRGITFNPVINLSNNGNSFQIHITAWNGNAGIIWKNFSAGNGDIFFRRTTPVPVLFGYENSERAIALDSVTMVRDPFPVTTTLNFSTDHRTRLMLFAANAALQPGEPTSVITAQVEDAQHRIVALPVEFVGQVPGFDWLTQINLRLPDELINAGDVKLSITVRGIVSNTAIVGIKPS